MKVEKKTKKTKAGERKKKMGLIEKTDQTELLYIKLAPISRCVHRHPHPLPSVRENVFFYLLYTCIYEVVGDLRALSITAFYCLNVDCPAPCA